MEYRKKYECERGQPCGWYQPLKRMLRTGEDMTFDDDTDDSTNTYELGYEKI